MKYFKSYRQFYEEYPRDNLVNGKENVDFFYHELQKEHNAIVERIAKVENKSLLFLGVIGVIFTLGITLTLNILSLDIVDGSSSIEKLYVFLAFVYSVLCIISTFYTYNCYKSAFSIDSYYSSIFESISDISESLASEYYVKKYLIYYMLENNRDIKEKLDSKNIYLKRSFFYFLLALLIIVCELILLEFILYGWLNWLL